VCARALVCQRERERGRERQVLCGLDDSGSISGNENRSSHYPQRICMSSPPPPPPLTREPTSKNIHLVPSKVVTQYATFFFIPRSMTFNCIPILCTLNNFRGCLQTFQVNIKIFNTIESSLRVVFVSAFVYRWSASKKLVCLIRY
jgi:hypothetical protein